MYLEPKCHLGELGQIHNSNPEINSTPTKIKIQRKRSAEHVSTVYDSVFNLPDTSLFDSVDFEDGEDLGNCGARQRYTYRVLQTIQMKLIWQSGPFWAVLKLL